MRLSGINSEQLREAAAVVEQVVGFSAYLHAVDYDVQQFRKELDSAVAHMRSGTAVPRAA